MNMNLHLLRWDDNQLEPEGSEELLLSSPETSDSLFSDFSSFDLSTSEIMVRVFPRPISSAETIWDFTQSKVLLETLPA
jgi:hypothetical protein